jgi:hypothetical protein
MYFLQPILTFLHRPAEFAVLLPLVVSLCLFGRSAKASYGEESVPLGAVNRL